MEVFRMKDLTAIEVKHKYKGKNKMLTEKVRNQMGKTISLNVKKNGKTIMKLNPQVVAAKMAALKSSENTKTDTGLFSKLTCILGKKAKE